MSLISGLKMTNKLPQELETLKMIQDNLETPGEAPILNKPAYQVAQEGKLEESNWEAKIADICEAYPHAISRREAIQSIKQIVQKELDEHSLEGLIAKCGHKFEWLRKVKGNLSPNNDWESITEKVEHQGLGHTPREAVENLLLAVNKD